MSRLRTGVVGLLALLAFQGNTVVDATGAHACPHHDAMPPAASGAMHAVEADAAPHAESHHDDREHGHEGPCTCIGNCQPGPGQSAVQAGSSALRFPDRASPDDAPAASSSSELPGQPSHFLPYPLGPPPLLA